ncbi:hypothetical protein PGT21_025016 [Puccinia graminis f. sp. tritici]|uniref:CBM1 domain-containing protein n=1 Tax=Puccinia graminis f. sp. tritici TaxID=56615 RepID=A0A5B0P110_PUCGR|nr:hypothetical protein PGT21_025016 [Puccinia graminis f. sp. tritici]KAA1129023.1 hypothetical protein PGTUg99_023977 [Puccinia graminis f. sp. tritici]
MKAHISLIMVALVVLLTFVPAASTRNYFTCDSPGGKTCPNCYYNDDGALVIPPDSQCYNS